MAALALSEILPLRSLNTILPCSRFPREFHENANTPFWRIGALVGDDIDDFGAAIKGNRIVDNLDAFEGRLLFLFGEWNEALDEASVEQFASHYADYRIVEIPDTGHSGPWEASSAVVDVMRDFLEEVR